jgi:hypothetical protein
MTDKKIFKAQAMISKITTMHDRTLRLQIECLELPADQEAVIFSARHASGWVLFAETELQVEDVVDLPDVQIDKNDKTPSQRLRAVLYRLWEQSSKATYPEFEIFYRAKMDKLIEGYKIKLN